MSSVIRITTLLAMSSLVNDALAQIRDPLSLHGIVIFPVTDSIPQEVILIPCTLDNLKDGTMGYLVMFSTMRWTQHDLLHAISDLKKEEVNIRGIITPYVSFFPPGDVSSELVEGNIVFDKSYPVSPDVPRDEGIYELELTINDTTYLIKYTNPPKEFGYPKMFIADP